MIKSTDKLVFICKKDLLWNWDAFQIVSKYFDNIHLLTWDAYRDNKQEADEELANIEYDYIISFWSEYIILPAQIEAAKKGAINVHPAPPEHPGLGMFSHIFAFPENRMFHGTTVHEVDSKLDSGQIYITKEFPCFGMTPAEVCRCSVMDSLELLETACELLYKGERTDALLKYYNPLRRWNSHLYTSKQELEWLSELPAHHIAHEAETYAVTLATNEQFFEQNKDKFDTYLEEIDQNEIVFA